MGTKTMSVEEELREATGEKKRLKNETPADYVERIVRAANDMETVDYKKMSEPSKKFVQKCVDLLLAEKPCPKAFPTDEAAADEDEDEADEDDDAEDEDDDAEDEDDDAEDEDEKPAAKAKPTKKAAKVADDDEDDEEEEEESDDDEAEDDEEADEEDGDDADEDEDASDDDEDDEEESDDDEEEPVAKKKKPKPIARDEDDEDEEIEDEDEDDEDKPKATKKRATQFVRGLIVKNPTMDREQLRNKIKKAGYDLGDTTVNIIFYDTHNVLSALKQNDKLVKDYAKMIPDKEEE